VTGLLLAGCVHINVVAPPPDPAPLSRLSDWGTPINPDEDCQFFLSDGMLLIHVPGTPGTHAMAPKPGTANAPRVLREARGDFTLQVTVEGGFAPGMVSMAPGYTPYNGASLVAMIDGRNFVTLARAVLRHGDSGPLPYANFEIYVNGTVAKFGEETETPVPFDGPIHLRLERRGKQMLGAWSTDGLDWVVLEPMDLPANWPRELQVGIVAINDTLDEFNPRFSGLQLLD
jgi:hypothetical protein